MSTMSWDFAAFGWHITLFPGVVVLFLAALTIACWTVSQFLRR